ncbi:hypothetical protein LPJ57_007096, partial [Coemansia sp. RSA 486]
MANMDTNGAPQPPAIDQSSTPAAHSVPNSLQSPNDQQQQHRYNTLHWQHQLMPQNISASSGAPGNTASVNAHQRRTDGGADQNKSSTNGAQVAGNMTSPTQTSQPPALLPGMKAATPTIASSNSLSGAAGSAAVPISMAPVSVSSAPTTASSASAASAPVAKKAPAKSKAKRGVKKTSAKVTATASKNSITLPPASHAKAAASSSASTSTAAAAPASANAPPDSAPSPRVAKSGGISNSGSSSKTNSSPALAIKASSALAASSAGKPQPGATSSPSFVNGLPLGSGAVNVALTDADSQFGGMTENAFSTLLSQRGSQATLHGGAVGITSGNDLVSAMNVNVNDLNLHLNEWFGDGASTEALNEILNMGATLGANTGSMSAVGEHHGGGGGGGNNGNGAVDSSQILGGYNINDPAAFSSFIGAGGANSSGANSLSSTLSMAMPMSIGMPISAPGSSVAGGALNAEAGNSGASNNVFPPPTAT